MHPLVSEANKIADAFVPYYESLFAQKTPDPDALRTCMEHLRNPDLPRVLPPTAEKCGAEITQAESAQRAPEGS